MAASSQDVARAINSMLSFSSRDQNSLLEVIEDYFTYPPNSSVRDPEDDLISSDDDDMEVDAGRKILQYTIKVQYPRCSIVKAW